MEGLLAKIPDFIEFGSLILSSIVILATVIAKLTPSKTDDEFVNKTGQFLMKVLAFLPKLGLNPQTKKLQEAYEELKALKAKEAAPKE